MAQADSGLINEELLDETAFLRELHMLLGLCSSSESASLLRQHEAILLINLTQRVVSCYAQRIGYQEKLILQDPSFMPYWMNMKDGSTARQT